jgi:Sushi repeat (SCR repeat)
MRSPKLGTVAALFALLLISACAEPQCPNGFAKIDDTCIRLDAGTAIATSEAGVIASGDVSEGGSSMSAPLDGSALGPTTPGNDGSTGPTPNADAAMTGNPMVPVAPIADAGGNPDPVQGPECDTAHPCAAGFVCSAMKCVSACTQTQCDPNATCAVASGAAVCTCNRGFIAMSGSGGAVTCARDVACEELACDPHADCKPGSDQLRQCVCKLGYTGDGKTCTPVNCGPLTVTHGTASTPDGSTTYGAMATVKCETGYQLPLFASATRKCDVSGQMGQWSGTAPVCTIVDCGPPPSASANGSVSAPQTTYNAQATYTCQAGYKPNGMAALTCLDTGRWSGGAPTCVATCGNGAWDRDVSPPETCDPTAPASDLWTCTSKCTRTTAYNPCSGQSTGCDTGQTCVQGTCSPSCSPSGPACPVPPGGLASTCVGSFCLTQGCRSSTDCAPGLICSPSTNPSLSPYCSGCNNVDMLCPFPKTCHFIGADTIGRCQ